MKIHLWEKRVEKQMLFVACVFMLFSLFFPYNKNISIIYQITAVVMIVLLGHDTACAFMPLFILSTIRSYVAVSIQARNASGTQARYYGLNDEMIMVSLILIAIIYVYRRGFIVRIEILGLLTSIFACQMLLSHYLVTDTAEYNSLFDSICIAYMVIPLLFQSEADVFFGRVSFVIGGAFLAVGIIPHILSKGNIYDMLVKVDRNYQSFILLLCILETVIYLLKEGKDKRLWIKMCCIAVVVADVFIVFTSASRSAIIALIIASLVLIIVNYRYISQTLFFVLVASIGICFALETGLLDFVLSRFTLSNMATGNGRTIHWANYLNAFEQSNMIEKIFGHGLVGARIDGSAAHNVFISILYSFGIMGLLLFVSVVCIITWRLIHFGNAIELVSWIPVIFMCCTIEPYYRIEFPMYIGMMIGLTTLFKEKTTI